MAILIVYFINGSSLHERCRDLREAYDKANNVSVSGGRVSRIEVMTSGGTRALWAQNWSAESQAAGLRFPD